MFQTKNLTDKLGNITCLKTMVTYLNLFDFINISNTCVVTILVFLKFFVLQYFRQPSQLDVVSCHTPVEAWVVCHHVFEVNGVVEMMLDKPNKLKVLFKNLHVFYLFKQQNLITHVHNY